MDREQLKRCFDLIDKLRNEIAAEEARLSKSVYLDPNNQCEPKYPNWLTAEPQRSNQILNVHEAMMSSVEHRIDALASRVTAAQEKAKRVHEDNDRRIQMLDNRSRHQESQITTLQRELRLTQANIALLAQRVEVRAKVDARSYIPREASLDQQALAYVHGSGCSREGDPTSPAECIECEPVMNEDGLAPVHPDPADPWQNVKLKPVPFEPSDE